MGIKKYLALLCLFSFIQPLALLLAADDQNRPFSYQIGFQQDLNSYSWLSQVIYKQIVFGKGILQINENFNSLLIRLNQNDHKWKDDQKFNLKIFFPYSQLWGMNFSTSANHFSDRLSGLVSDIKTNWAKVGLRLQPLSSVELNSGIGYKYDNRLARTDDGIIYDIKLKTDSINIKDYENQLYFLNRGDRYSVRKNDDFALQYHVKKKFQQGSFDSLSIYWTKQRRDNYDLINTNEVFIESLKEQNRGLRHHLIYDAQGDIQFNFRTLVNSRQTSIGRYDEGEIAESRSKKDFHSENEIGLIYRRSSMMLNLALIFETNNQKNNVPDSLKAKRFSKYFYYISPDYQSSRLTLSTGANFYLFKSDTLQLNSSISRYRYDTPENNMDDRDEFRMNINLSEIHHFNPFLKLISKASVNLYHLVYIFGERSANNNWMRIFRIYPRVVFQPNKNISVEHQVEVLANYVDYDYDFGTSSSDLKSYIFRRFSLTQLVTARITNRTSIFINHKLEMEENGKLDWNRWTEFLQTSRENHWVRINLNYKIQRHLTLSPGFLYFKRVEKQHNLSSFPVGIAGQRGGMESYGPILKLTYYPHQKLNFSFEGMRRVVTMKPSSRQYINHFDVTLSWYY